MGRLVILLLVLFINASVAEFIFARGPDHSKGIPCPGNMNKETCLPGYRCEEGSGKNGCVRSFSKIAFEAYTTNTVGHFPNGKVLIFPEVSVNDGQGYNSKTGIFKAPVAGMYHFTVHVCSARSKHMVVAIMKGGEQIAVTTVFTEPYSGCGSHSTMARVAENESVHVEARWVDSRLQSDIYRWPSFSGFLMYRYD
ncbi:heavy metal-binding protein HIP-like isoform X1 [Ruditapes philippinarum]|uniref:heavy metal-binding protein HIP-like isoform X1 n=1 Tax=Ruditapes philippinarum TaxID=129788 RepID=UPI00295B1991|nr:heavy metal-binding protein HIP-like isoform X1 [Ruditapes philippinarum]